MARRAATHAGAPRHAGPHRCSSLLFAAAAGVTGMGRRVLQEFKIQNMVGSCDVKFPIRLEGLASTHAVFCSVSAAAAGCRRARQRHGWACRPALAAAAQRSTVPMLQAADHVHMCVRGPATPLPLQYEPELFPGLIYRMADPKIVLLIFVSGKVGRGWASAPVTQPARWLITVSLCTGLVTLAEVGACRLPPLGPPAGGADWRQEARGHLPRL